MYRCSTVPPVYLVCRGLLPHQRLERVVGKAHGQLGRVGVVRLLGSARLQDAGASAFFCLPLAKR